jgi:DNA adenine methylase
MKPFLKWAGGKRQLLREKILPIITQYLEKDNNYYEPFVGAGSVFLELKHSKTIINDSNEDLMICYEVVKESSTHLMSILENYKCNHSKENFYNVRALDRDEDVFRKLTNVERAARLIYLNKTCFNGLYRVNKKGQFNTPIGSYKNPSIYDRDNIKEISEYMNTFDVDIRNVDFEEAVKDAKKGDFIYFDPPYDYDEKGFSSYQKEGFNRFDLERLKKVCDDLISRGCHVLISNNNTEKVRELFKSDDYELIDIKYTIKTFKANRSIGSKNEYRKQVEEVLIHGSKKI